MKCQSLFLNEVMVQVDMVAVECPYPVAAAVFGPQIKVEQGSCALHAYLACGYAGASKLRGGVLQISC